MSIGRDRVNRLPRPRIGGCTAVLQDVELVGVCSTTSLLLDSQHSQPKGLLSAAVVTSSPMAPRESSKRRREGATSDVQEEKNLSGAQERRRRKVNPGG